jgi:hypothetical protein
MRNWHQKEVSMRYWALKQERDGVKVVSLLSPRPDGHVSLDGNWRDANTSMPVILTFRETLTDHSLIRGLLPSQMRP